MLHLRRYKRQKPLALDDDAEIDSVDDVERDNSDSLSIESSSWSRTAQDIVEVIDSNVTVVYLDFVSDVEQMTELLKKNKTTALKYTGNVRFEERVSVEKRFLKRDASVLVATESYELGVDNYSSYQNWLSKESRCSFTGVWPCWQKRWHGSKCFSLLQ